MPGRTSRWGRGLLGHTQDDHETFDRGRRCAPAVAVVGTRTGGALACRPERASARASGDAGLSKEQLRSGPRRVPATAQIVQPGTPPDARPRWSSCLKARAPGRMTERWSSVWRVLAAWYERPGQAADVLQVGEMADPEPGPGEVRVRVAVSGINPGDTKKRGDWVGYGMPYPRVIPHSDGAGVIDAVGDHVDPARTGERVWVYGAQSYRPFGTAAQLTVVRADQAVALPNNVSDEVGASGHSRHHRPSRRLRGPAGRRYDGPRPWRARRRRLDGGSACNVAERHVIGTVRQQHRPRPRRRHRHAPHSARRGRPHRIRPPGGARRCASHRRGLLLRQRGPRRRSGRARSGDRRLRHPRPTPCVRLPAHALRQPDHRAA